MRYIALLRGINVLGNTKVSMDELRSTFGSLGFDNVKTYINSGNVAFDTSKTTETRLIDKIERAVEQQAGRPVQVMVRDRGQIEHAIAMNPFKGQYESHKQMNVLFLKDEVPADKVAELLSWQTEKERLAASGREIYALLLGGMAESLLGRGLIERRLKMPVTVRNWRTVEKLAHL